MAMGIIQGWNLIPELLVSETKNKKIFGFCCEASSNPKIILGPRNEV